MLFSVLPVTAVWENDESFLLVQVVSVSSLERLKLSKLHFSVDLC
jgi:hypothetical protein